MGAEPAGPPLAARVSAICPYLLAEDGTWRAATPDRRHRCTALRPPVPLATAKQAALCLTPEHGTCPYFVSAQKRRADADEGSDRLLDRASRLRPVARSVPVSLDPGPALPGSSVVRRSREVAQAALAAAMLIAGAGLISARGPGTEAARAAEAARDRRAIVASGTPAPSPRPTRAPAVAFERSPSPPSASPTPAPTPAASERPRTYRVRRGDTLSGIAARFDTTVTELQRLNRIADPNRLRVGQVLRLP